MRTAANPISMFSTRNDLGRDVRGKIVDLLNQQLADTFDLYSQTKQAHWNVKGAQFFRSTSYSTSWLSELAGYVDQIAERATALGGLAHGTVRMSAAKSQLPECEPDVTDSLPTVEALADRYAALAASHQTSNRGSRGRRRRRYRRPAHGDLAGLGQGPLVFGGSSPDAKLGASDRNGKYVAPASWALSHGDLEVNQRNIKNSL